MSEPAEAPEAQHGNASHSTSECHDVWSRSGPSSVPWARTPLPAECRLFIWALLLCQQECEDGALPPTPPKPKLSKAFFRKPPAGVHAVQVKPELKCSSCSSFWVCPIFCLMGSYDIVPQKGTTFSAYRDYDRVPKKELHSSLWVNDTYTAPSVCKSDRLRAFGSSRKAGLEIKPRKARMSLFLTRLRRESQHEWKEPS